MAVLARFDVESGYKLGSLDNDVHVGLPLILQDDDYHQWDAWRRIGTVPLMAGSVYVFHDSERVEGNVLYAVNDLKRKVIGFILHVV